MSSFWIGKKQYDAERISVSTTPIGITASKFLDTDGDNSHTGKFISACVFTIVSGSGQWTQDPGTTLSGSNGTPIAAGDVLPVYSQQKARQTKFYSSGGMVVEADLYHD